MFGTIESTSHGDGTFTYDPNGQFEDLEEGQSATDSFSYTISDGRGGTSTGIVYIFIDGLAEPNQAPEFDEPDTIPRMPRRRFQSMTSTTTGIQMATCSGS